MAAESKISEMDKQIAKGLAAVQAEVKIELDTAGAEAYKTEVEARLAAMKVEEDALTGKDNKKARQEKGKEISALKAEKKYIDATKVCKGLEPPGGNFVIAASAPAVEAAPVAAAVVEEAPAEEEKAEKEKKPVKKKKGLSDEEKVELEKLKTDLVARKTQLKADGMSGGQMNKDEQVAAWVKRMNELKEILEPGSTGKKGGDDGKTKKKGKMTAEDQTAFDELKQKIEDYTTKCKAEFGYTNKDLKADPDLVEMNKQLAEFEKKSKK